MPRPPAGKTERQNIYLAVCHTAEKGGNNLQAMEVSRARSLNSANRCLALWRHRPSTLLFELEEGLRTPSPVKQDNPGLTVRLETTPEIKHQDMLQALRKQGERTSLPKLTEPLPPAQLWKVIKDVFGSSKVMAMPLPMQVLRACLHGSFQTSQPQCMFPLNQPISF